MSKGIPPEPLPPSSFDGMSVEQLRARRKEVTRRIAEIEAARATSGSAVRRRLAKQLRQAISEVRGLKAVLKPATPSPAPVEAS